MLKWTEGKKVQVYCDSDVYFPTHTLQNTLKHVWGWRRVCNLTSFTVSWTSSILFTLHFDQVLDGLSTNGFQWVHTPAKPGLQDRLQVTQQRVGWRWIWIY